MSLLDKLTGPHATALRVVRSGPRISDRGLERALQFQTRPDDITPAQVRALLLG